MPDEDFQKTLKSALTDFFERIKSVYPDNQPMKQEDAVKFY